MPMLITNVLLIFCRAGQCEQAIEQAQIALELDPKYGPAYYGLGQAYEQKRMYEEAITAHQEGVALSGRGPRQVAALGHAYLDTKPPYAT